MSAPQKGVSRGVAWSVPPMNAHEAALAAEGCQPLANIGDLCERFGSMHPGTGISERTTQLWWATRGSSNDLFPPGGVEPVPVPDQKPQEMLSDGTAASPASERVCKHMNEDHAASVLGYAWNYAGVPGAIEATMEAVSLQGTVRKMAWDGALLSRACWFYLLALLSEALCFYLRRCCANCATQVLTWPAPCAEGACYAPSCPSPRRWWRTARCGRGSWRCMPSRVGLNYGASNTRFSKYAGAACSLSLPPLNLPAAL